jgi:hypothetical protein
MEEWIELWPSYIPTDMRDTEYEPRGTTGSLIFMNFGVSL